jgi:hypothetical protein
MPATPKAPAADPYTETVRCKWHTGPGRKLCGSDRKVKPQDVWQVRYCVEHTKMAKAKRARERRAAKRAVKS